MKVDFCIHHSLIKESFPRRRESRSWALDSRLRGNDISQQKENKR